MNQELLYLNGQVYKIGLMGKVFAEREDDWHATDNLTADQFRDELKKQKKPRHSAFNGVG